MHIYTGNNKILFYCNDNAEDHINCKTEKLKNHKQLMLIITVVFGFHVNGQP